MSELARAPLKLHLIELRNRLTVSVLAWLVLSGIAFHFAADIAQFLTKPLQIAFADHADRRLIYTSLTESFLAYIKLALVTGFALAFPFVAFQLYRFLAPGLYAREKKSLLPFLLMAPLLFFAGAAFAYYLVMPLAWGFFLSFEQSAAPSQLPLVLEAKISEYISLCLQLILAFGLAFQLPVVLVLLARAGVISVGGLKRNRRYAVVILLALAAIITPPDIISQLMLFTPLYVLYELSIVFGKTKSQA